jgi:hypothetical protein
MSRPDTSRPDTSGAPEPEAARVDGEEPVLLVDRVAIGYRQRGRYLTYKGIDFTTAPHGLLKIGAFMKEIGLIKKASDWRALVFDTVKNENGS